MEVRRVLFRSRTHIPASRRTPPPGGQDVLPEEYRRSLDPLVALAAAASATKSLRLGTGILLPAQREPIVTAKAVATLDHMSGGRAALGVGFGRNRSDERRVGKECVSTCRSRWAPDH